MEQIEKLLNSRLRSREESFSLVDNIDLDNIDATYRVVVPLKVTPRNVLFLLSKLKCEQCGWCCKRITDGALLGPSDMNELPNYLGVSKHQFKDRYTIITNKHRMLRVPCPFYSNDTGCSVYLHRPQVCRQFPVNNKLLYGAREYITIVCCPAGKKIIVKYFRHLVPQR